MADQEIGSLDLETKEVLYFVSSSKDKSGIQMLLINWRHEQKTSDIFQLVQLQAHSQE